MDERAASDYHAALLEKLQKKQSPVDRLIWIPALSASGYYTFEGFPGLVFGGLVGWGICAILSTLDSLRIEIWYADWLRHLHEHTDEAETGERLFKRNAVLDKVTRRWWQF